MKLEYNKILITGHTFGIGKALTEKFCELNNQIIAVGRNTERLNTIARSDGRIIPFQCDISLEPKIGRLVTFLMVMLFSITAFAQHKEVLIVMSAADTLPLNNGEKQRQTGVFLNEFYLAYQSVSEAGYAVDFATPNGIVATIDEESIDDKYWKNKLDVKEEALQFIHTDSSFNNPKTLEEAIENKPEYIGLIIPGGQGLMIDLAYDKNIPVLLKHFAKGHKPTGLICHAPSLILTIPKEENPYIGFKVNSVSPLEEFVIERFIMKGKPKNRKIAKKLRKLGLKYKHGLPKANYAVKDRNLISSQNPFSGSAFNELYLKALAEYLDKERKPN